MVHCKQSPRIRENILQNRRAVARLTGRVSGQAGHLVLRILTHPKNSTAFSVLSFWVGVHISCHTESREIRRIRVRRPKTPNGVF